MELFEIIITIIFSIILIFENYNICMYILIFSIILILNIEILTVNLVKLFLHVYFNFFN